MRAILDTSVFIAREQGRAVADVAGEEAISVVTIAELHVGVLTADDPDARAQRLRTLAEVESAYDALAVDEDVARCFAGLVAAARRAGQRPRIMDALIAATAITHGAAVMTQDADFDGFPGLTVLRV